MKNFYIGLSFVIAVSLIIGLVWHNYRKQQQPIITISGTFYRGSKTHPPRVTVFAMPTQGKYSSSGNVKLRIERPN